MAACAEFCIAVLFAVLLPPIGIWIYFGAHHTTGHTTHRHTTVTPHRIHHSHTTGTPKATPQAHHRSHHSHTTGHITGHTMTCGRHGLLMC